MKRVNPTTPHVKCQHILTDNSYCRKCGALYKSKVHHTSSPYIPIHSSTQLSTRSIVTPQTLIHSQYTE